MKKVLMASAVALLMVGCGDSTPECSDSNVKKLVAELFTHEVAYMRTVQIMKGSGVYVPKETLPPKQVKKYLKEYDIKVTSIRTDSIDEKLKKVTCKAQMTTNYYQPIDVSYVAQTTDDGNLFVEMYGSN